MANWRESAERIFGSGSANNSNTVSIPKTSATNTTTSGTNNSGSWRDSAQNILDSVGYVPQKQRKYELKLNDGTSFGVVSYDAYNAIINNNLDNYTPKSQDEKTVLDNYKTAKDKEFQKKSTYKSTKNGKEKHRIPGTTYYDETGYDDIEHDYINGDEEAIGIVTANEVQSGKWILGTDSQFLKSMKPEEKAIYNYIYNVEGKEAGKKYLKDISGDLKLRQRLSSQDELADYAKKNKWNAFTSSMATIIASPLKTVSAVGQINDYLDDGVIDQNAGYNKYVYNTNAVRNAVSEEIEKGSLGKVGSFLYNTGMSIGDSVMNTIASGGNKFLSLGTMGIGAFANTVVSSKDRGLSDNQAVGLGVVSAIAEVFTESFSWDKLFGAKNIGEGLFNGAEKGVKNYILDNIKTNALEEMGADGINFVADVLISKDKSEWQNSVNKYIKDGYSKEEAWTLTFKDTATQFALSGLAGALSGATMSGSTGAVIGSRIKSVGKANSNNVLGIIGEGLSFEEGSEAYQNAMKLAKAESEITDYDLGRQVLLNDVHKINTTISEGLSFDKNSEAYKNAVKLKKSKDGITPEALEHQMALNEAQKNGTSVVSEENSVVEPSSIDPAAELNETIQSESQEVVETDTPSATISVGDVFNDTKSGSTVTVLERDGESTTVQVDTGNGVRTQKMANNVAENFVAIGQLKKVGSVEGTKEATVPTETNDVTSATKNINLKRVGNFYEAYGKDAQMLAEELELETQKAVINGVETDILRLPADLTQKLSNNIDDDFNLVLSDNPISSDTQNANVTDETTTTDEVTPSAEEDATEVKIEDVVNAIEETLTEQAKVDLQNGEIKDNYIRIAETLVEVYKADGTIEAFADFFVDGGKKVEATIKGEIDNVDVANDTTTTSEKESTAEVLKNESESDTMESKSETTPVESEDNGNERRSDTLSGNSRRGYNGSARKQAERISYFERENQGRDATERQNFTREVTERGQVEEVTVGRYKYNLIKPEAYNDDMKSMVEEAKKKGVELQFIVGKVRVGFDTKDEFTVRGLKLSDSKVVVQYDNAKSSQRIAKHEIIHAKWNTPEIQEIKDTILNSLTEEDKQSILSQDRYSRYKEMYKGDENAVLEEFVCDVMSGDSYYYADHIDMVSDYWYGNEELNSYNVSEYSESIDAGGKSAESKYDIDEKQGDEKNGVDKGRKANKNGGIHNKSETEVNTEKILQSRNRNNSKRPRIFSSHKGRSRRVEKSPIQRVVEKENFIKLSNNIVGNITWSKNRELYLNYENDNRWDSGYSFAEMITYDMLSDETNNLRNLFHDEISEYFNGGKLSTNQDITGEYVSDEILEITKGTVIVNEGGHLIPIYHATPTDFEKFESGDLGIHMGSFSQAITHAQNRVEHLKESKDMYMIKAYGVLKKPLMVEDGDYNWTAKDCLQVLNKAGALSHEKMMYFWEKANADNKSATNELREYLVNEGYDGIIYENNIESVSGTSYLLFDNSQVIQLEKEKFNVDDYNSDVSNDIRYDIDDADSEYMKAVESGDTETVAKMIEDAAEKSFPNSKVRGDDGKLKLVYHGRVSDFNVFDRSFANAEGDFGKGYYFTSNEYDVDANYANEEGPDLKNKISKLAERLEWEDEYADLSYDERKEIARQRLITSEPSVITAYLNMENPVYITPDEKGTFLDYTEEYDEEYDEYGEPEGLLIDFIEALKNNSYDYAYRDVDFDFLYEYALDNGGMYASDAVKIIKERVFDELSDENGDIATNEVIRLAFEEIGFDGIIDTSVYYKFRNMNGMDSGTTHYIVFNSEQIKSADLTTYDDKGNIIPLSERFNENNKDIRYDVDDGSQLKTQKKIESIAKEINSHEELISLTKQNTKEFVDKIKENKSLQKRLDNAKRQASLSPKPIINIAKVGQVTKDVLKEMESTLKATDLKDEIISIYTEYFDSMKKASGVESKVQEANDNMMNRFASLAVDIADSAVAYAESEGYMLLKSYLKDVRIKVPDHAKGEAHYAEFRKSHMGTFNLTNDGMDIDMVYQELCDMFPGMFDVEVSNAVDQLYAIADKVETLKPYAYNPHIEYMEDAIDHIVYRFASEVDGIAANPKTKAQKIAEKGAYDKEMALEKERASFERKLDRHKKNSEKTIQALQKKIGDSEYVRYWEKRLSKDEKTQAVNKVRERQKVAVLKTKIRNIVSSMKKKLDKNEKVGGYPRELVKTVADVCSALDFHTDRTGKGGTPTKVSLKLDALKMEYDALKNNENYDFSSEYSEELSGSIGELHKLVKDKRVIDLTANELSQLKDILSEIDHRLSNAMKQIGIASAKANAEIGSEIIDSLKSRSDAIKSDRTQLLKEMEIAKNRGVAFVINPHRINKMIAGYDTNSAWWQVYDGINRGSRKASKFVMDANKPFDELVDGGGNEFAFYDFRTKNIKTGIKYIDGSEVEIPKSIICELVMMWDRKQGKTHLETGGAKIPNMELYNKGKTTVAITDAGKRTAPITQADIDRLKTKLDSYDKAWIEKAHHLFNNVSKNAINETSMELVGRELAKEENYIRMYVDQDFIRREIDGKKEDATLESHGSLKETVPNAKQPVVLRGLHENVYDNIDFSSKYYGLAIPIRNFNKVYNIVIRDGDSRNSVKELIGQKFGSAIRTNVVEQLIRDLQAPRPRSIEPFGQIRGKWLGAIFWGNIRSALKQTTSYLTASSILGEGSLVKGLIAYATHSKQTKAEINKHSGTLYKRSQGLSTTELGDRANRKRLAGASNKVTKFINEKAPVLRKVPEWIRPSNWLQSMDVAVSSALWDACKVEISKTMDVSDEGYMQAVTDLYERVIEETQSNYDVAHRPEALKNKSAVVQAVTMFQTDSLQQTGILIDAFNDYKIKSELYKKNKSSANEKAKNEAKKGLSKAIRSRVYSSLWLVFATHVGNMLLRKFKPYVDEEEKEITSSSFAKQSLLMLCDDMLGVFLPVVGQLLTKVADTWSEGYDFVTEPTFDVLEDFIKDTNKIWDAMTDYDDEVSWKERALNTKNAFIEAIPSISNITGVPAKNISDWVTAIKGYAGDIKEGEFAHDISEYGSSKSFYSYGDLATHIASGNKEKQKKILDYYEANEKEFSQGLLTKEIKSAYVQALVDSPEKARNIKRTLILDYDYKEDAIDGWGTTVYFDNIVEEPEYAEEIKTALQNASAWDKNDVSKSAESRYKGVYKSGNEDEIKKLRDALLNANVVSNSSLNQWESETDKKTKEENKELEKTKRKYKE